MQKREYETLLKAIRGIYPTFKGYDDLINYKYEEVYKNFALHKGTEEPTYDELTYELKYESEKDVWMQCDLCKEKIYYTTWEDFDKHYRKCQKIDFINRQAKEIKGEGIDYNKYRTMSDDELETRYRKIMDNWKATHTPGTILKTI